MDIPNKPVPGNRKAAQQLAQGLTLVPYRAFNGRGHLTWYCKWAKLQRGESLSQAAVRLSVPPPQPVWTRELKARVARLIQQIAQPSSSSISAGTSLSDV